MATVNKSKRKWGEQREPGRLPGGGCMTWARPGRKEKCTKYRENILAGDYRVWHIVGAQFESEK